MRTTQLGTTGLTVTPIGLGLAALGRPAYLTLGRAPDLGDDRSVDAMARRCHAMLDAAYAAGIRYVDTARSYGLAERFLASWLAAHGEPDGPVTVGSKWGYAYTGDWRLDAPTHEEKSLTLETLRRQLPESRALLGDRLDLYQVHSATLESGIFDDREVLRELARLRAGGLAIGLTVSGPRQGDAIRRALAVDVDGVSPFQAVQATWNVLEPSAGAALADAHARGWGVIVKEVLANGRLTDRHAAGPVREMAAHAASIGASLDGLAVAAALSQGWTDVVLSGAVSPAQLQSNVSALSVPRERLGSWEALAEPPAEYWSRRGTMTWM